MNMVMRGKSVKTNLVVILVVGCLVALAQTKQAQAQSAHCCCIDSLPTMAAYAACRPFGGVQTCCSYCAGHMSNALCFYPYTKMSVNLQGISETDYSNKVVDYCKMGCMTSVSNKIPTSVVGGTNGGKDVVERVTSACHDFCTHDNSKIAEVHGA